MLSETFEACCKFIGRRGSPSPYGGGGDQNPRSSNKIEENVFGKMLKIHSKAIK